MARGFDSVNPYRVENPTNPHENFADKWEKHPELRMAFFHWLKRLKGDVHGIYGATGFREVSRHLENMLGSRTKIAALRAHSDGLNDHLERGALYAAPGTMNIVTRKAENSISVRRHTNYGG